LLLLLLLLLLHNKYWHYFTISVTVVSNVMYNFRRPTINVLRVLYIGTLLLGIFAVPPYCTRQQQIQHRASCFCDYTDTRTTNLKTVWGRSPVFQRPQEQNSPATSDDNVIADIIRRHKLFRATAGGGAGARRRTRRAPPHSRAAACDKRSACATVADTRARSLGWADARERTRASYARARGSGAAAVTGRISR